MNIRRFLLIAVPYAWLLALFLLPFLIVAKLSLSDSVLAIPPYTPTFSWSEGWGGLRRFLAALDFESFRFLAEDSLYWQAFLSSLRIAFVATLLTLLVGFPVALGMANAPERWRPLLMLFIVLPFWTSFLIRIYSWMGILNREGFLNQLLLWLGAVEAPLRLLNTDGAVYVGIVYTYLPFMVLPIYAGLARMDPFLLEAAEDLGCGRVRAFWLITAPLSRPGVAAGCFLVFVPALGEFVVPSLLGGSHTLMIGKVLWEEFFSNRDWPVAAAVAVALLGVVMIPIVLFQRRQERRMEAER